MSWQERIRVRIAQITRRWGTDLLAVRWLPVSGGSAGSQTKTVSDSNNANPKDAVTVTNVGVLTQTLSDKMVLCDYQYLDNFNRANGVLSSVGSFGWVQHGGHDELTISGNQVVAQSVSGGSSTENLDLQTNFSSADQVVSVKVVTAPPVNSNFCVYVRAANSAGNVSAIVGYKLVVDTVGAGTTSFALEVDNGTTNTIIISDTSVTVASNDIWELSIIGTALTVKKNGIIVGAVSDSTLASGVPALGASWANTVDPIFDDFSVTVPRAFNVGYGNLVSDSESANWLDVFAETLTGGALTKVLVDTITIADALGDGVGNLLVDSMTLAEALAKTLDFGEPLSDSESANWLDVLVSNVLGLNEATSDTLSLSDVLLAGYGALNSDQIVLADSTSLGYGFLLSDSEANNWADAFAFAMQLAEALSDNLNSWLDFLQAGFGASTSDQLVLTDSASAGYGFLLSDTESANWLDTLVRVLGLNETLSDDESGNWADFLQAGFGAVTSDQIVLIDSVSMGYGFLLSDSESANWLDALVKASGVAEVLLDNLNNWLDFVAAGFGSAASDQVVLTDSASSGYGFLLSDSETGNWSDVLITVLGLNEVLSDDGSANWLDFLQAGFGATTSDQLVIVDSVSSGFGNLLSGQLIMSDGPVTETNSWLIAVICPHLNNWSDVLNLTLGLNELLTDTESANWADTFSNVLGLNETSSDVLSLSDVLSVGYGFLLSDNLNNWLDASTVSLISSGALTLAVSDSLNNWLDVVALVLGLNEILSDSETANWLDSLTKTFDLLELLSDSESGNWSDFLLAGFGMMPSDQLVIVDSVSSGYGFLLSDSESGNWLDSVTISVQLSEVLSDNLNNWLDALLVGFGALNSDQIVIVDSVSMGYGFLLNDNLNSWLDAAVVVVGLFEVLTDSESTNWSDFLAAGFGSLFSDQLVLADSTSMGYGFLLSDNLNNWLDAAFLALGLNEAISDVLILTDSLSTGYGALVSDSLNNWLDAVIVAEVFDLILSDNLNNWTDFLLVGFGMANSDQIVLADSTSAGYGFLLSDSESANWNDAMNFTTGAALIQITVSDNLNNWLDFLQVGFGALNSDQIVLVDSASMGYGFLLSDSINNWLDLVQRVLGMVVQVSDSESANWLDFLQAGFGALFSDQVVLTDSASAGYGFLLSDSLNNWLDLVQLVTGILEVLSDIESANWVDALQIGYGDLISDPLTLNDQLSAGFGASTSDQLVILDSSSVGYGFLLSDNLNSWLDSIQLLVGLLIQIVDSESTNWADSLLAGFGAATSDQLVILDSNSVGYGFLLSDTLNNWLDAAIVSLLGSGVLTLTLSDNLNNWLDALRAGYGAATSDQLVILDSASTGYGFLLSDSESTNWLDTLTQTLDLDKVLSDTESANWLDTLAKILGMNEAPSDTLTLADFTLLGYGSATSDQLILVDSLSSGFGALLSDNLNNWTEALGIGYGDAVADAFPGMLDRLSAGYGMATSDQLVLVDSTSAGYGLLLSDNLNNWLDLLVFQILTPGAFTLTVSDNLNNWIDALGIGYGLLDSDQLVLSDFLGAGYGAGTSDQLVLVDSASMGYGFLLNDNSLNNWLDFAALFEIDLLQVSDNLLVFDQLGVGYGLLTQDSAVWVDSLQVGYGFVITDGGIVWQDLVVASTGNAIPLTVSDNLNNWADALLFGMSTNRGPAKYFRLETISRTLFDRLVVNSKAKYEKLAVESRVVFYLNETLVTSLGGPTEGIGLGLTLSDNLNNWLESFAAVSMFSGTYALNLSDNTGLSDSLRIEYGMAVVENLNNWLDFYGPGVMTLTLADNLNSWMEVLGVGYGDVLADNLNAWGDFIPGFVVDYGADIGDTMNFWKDQFTGALM